MKKLLFCIFLSLIVVSPLTFLGVNCFAETESKTYIVTANQASLFSAPSLTSEKIGTLSHKAEIEISCEEGVPLEFSDSNFIFYLVSNYETESYILADLVVPRNDFLTDIPNFNAKTNSSTSVYFFEDGNYVESEIKLEKHHNIFLYEGYNKKKTYNAVAFVYENEVVYGYIKKEAIDPNGINPVIITVLCVVLALLGIIFALLFMKKRGASRIKK